VEAKLKLNLDALAVESFEAANNQQPAQDNLVTCLQTDCGPYRCCA
jgi:hypothetical protein